MKHSFASIDEAIETLKAGKMIILMDEFSRENEGDLVIAAEHVTPDAINFMSRKGCGLICLPMAEELITQLNLPMMTTDNQAPFKTAFTTSIEAASGVSTGISAKDRAHTIKTAIAPECKPSDLICPGHVFPLRAQKNGVLKRAGQTEGSVDLVRLAGLRPAAVICEVINPDGTMSRYADLLEFSKCHGLPLVSIKDLIKHRVCHEELVREAASSTMTLSGRGTFQMMVFENDLDDCEHFALIKPPKHANQVPLVRVHSECLTGDIFGSCRCDCGQQLEASLDLITSQGGVLIYLRQEGRGIGLANKLKAYALQEQGYDTVEANIKLGFSADGRDYAIAFQILKYLGLDVIRLITNNPLKISTLEQYGMTISERIPLQPTVLPENYAYLKTKKEKLGHLLTID